MNALRYALLCIAAAVIAAGPAAAQSVQRAEPSSQAQIQLSFAPVAARASPAVVNVYAQRIVRQRGALYQDPFFGRFGGAPVERRQQSLGSGVIVRANGLIVTNHHVVEGAQSLKVVLGDRREFDAELVVADPRTDLAVLRIDTRGERLPFLELADTRRLQVGDLVLAIGNPFGLSRTVTSGIISALARTEVGINDYAFFIQTDAAINRGNSGGALVDMQGRLVGVNTAIYSETGGSNGIGFAIPAEMVRRVIDGAQSGGRVIRPWLGARVQPVTSELARSLGLPNPQGVITTDIYPASAAARAGLGRGDVILRVAGATVNDEAGLRYQFATQQPGSTVAVDIARGAARLTLSIRAEPPPGANPPASRLLRGRHPLDGAEAAALNPAFAEASGLDPLSAGVRIQAISGAGLAARAGLQPGDVIRAVNGQPVRSVEELERALAAAVAWRLQVERGGRTAELALRL